METEAAPLPAAAPLQPPAPLGSPITVEVEVCLHATSTARPSEIKDRVRDVLQRACRASGAYTPGPLPRELLRSDEQLTIHVLHARICEILSPEASAGGPVYLQSAGFWESDLQM